MKFELDESRVVREIAPGDAMSDGNTEAYFAIGRAALDCIAPGLDASPKKRFPRILDLACGHGRVLRWLRAAFPKSEITACDIETDGVDFCARTFDAVPVYSAVDPHAIRLEGTFDLIWCGSLLTHLDTDGWNGFLDLVQSVLAPGGVLTFTVHGRRVAYLLGLGVNDLGLAAEPTERLLDSFHRTGFGYEDYAGQDGYGISLSSPGWVSARITEIREWRLAHFREAGWKNFQDCVSCVRTPIDWLPPGLRATLGEAGAGFRA